MADQRCTITESQRAVLEQRFREGMDGVNKKTEDVRKSVANETGLTLQSVNVSVC